MKSISQCHLDSFHLREFLFAKLLLDLDAIPDLSHSLQLGLTVLQVSCYDHLSLAKLERCLLGLAHLLACRGRLQLVASRRQLRQLYVCSSM